MLDEKLTIEYIRKAKNGDGDAKELLLEHNVSLVKCIVKRYLGKGVDYDDLFQIACMGFLKAIMGFDESFGVKFSTYAVPMIIGELRRYLRDNNPIRVSRSVRDLAYKALTAKEALSAKLSREPKIEEIAGEIGSTREDVAMALDAIADPVSLYEPVYSENGDSVYVMDKVYDTNNTDENWLERIAITQAIEKLSDREKRIIMMRFFHGRTQMEVADEIAISQAQVSRLEKGALEKIKKDIGVRN